MGFASVPVSKFLPWVPALADLHDGLACKTNKPFHSRLFLVSVLLQEQRSVLEHTDTVLYMVLTFFSFPPLYFVSFSTFLLLREDISRILYFAWDFVCVRPWRVNPGSCVCLVNILPLSVVGIPSLLLFPHPPFTPHRG